MAVLKPPMWTESVLQALPYWVGYQRGRYSGHWLTEGAIVAELTSLIAGYLGRNCTVVREKSASDLAEGFGAERIDVFVDSPLGANREQSVIEVKPADAMKKRVTEDLKKLAKVLQNTNDNQQGLRAFLILVGEQKLPERFVKVTEDESPYAIRVNRSHERVDGYDHIVAVPRRVCIAASSLKSRKNVHSATLIEILKLPI